jgi:hypothetical protein
VDVFDLFNPFFCVEVQHTHLATLIADHHEFRPSWVNVDAGNRVV